MDKKEIYETLGDAYFSDNAHEKEIIDHLPMLLKEASLVVDVGASLGQYTRAMTRSMSGGKVHAIEADPIRAEQLLRNCDEWGRESTNQISVHQMAVSDRRVARGSPKEPQGRWKCFAGRGWSGS